MSVFSNLINVNNNGEITYSNWIEWQHKFFGLFHCSVCLALNQCWFARNKMPEIPQHEKCHCSTFRIAKPTLKSINAECDIRKFTEYIFSEKYAWNGKRDLFEILGFNKSDSYFLKSEYENQAAENYCNGNYILDKLDSQGQRINIKIKFSINNRDIEFISGWMVKPKGKITNNTPLAD